MKKEFILYAVLCVGIASLFGFESYQYTPKDDDHFKSLKISDLDELEINVSANVYFISSGDYEIKIEGNKNLIENLRLESSKGKMVVKVKKTANPIDLIKMAYNSDEPLNIYISAPDAKNIQVINRGNFNTTHYYENEDVAMITLKSPKLFSFEPGAATCEENKTSNS